MLADLAQTALGLLLGPLVFVLPGLALAHGTNVFDARNSPLSVRLALGVALSIALGPIVLYLGLHLGWTFALGVYAVLGLAGLASLIPLRPDGTAWVRPGLIALAVMTVVVLLIVDLGGDDRLYFSVVARDYLKHFVLTNEIAQHGVPPSNPFFSDGSPAPLFYYYGWLLMTSALDVLGGSLLGPRGAVFAGTAFCALGLMSIVALYTSTLPNPLTTKDAPGRGWSRTALAVAFLLVGGLDVIVFLAGAAALAVLGRPVVFTDIEWWNEPLFLWITSVLTVPHHTAGFIAALTGMRLVRWGADSVDRRRWAAYGLAGLAFASTALFSIWMAIGAAVIGAVWVGWRALRRDGTEIVAWAVTGIVSAIAVLPYALDLRAAGSTDGSPIAFGIRPFGPLIRYLDIGRTGAESLLHLPFLPLSYTLELGFVALAGFLFWRARRRIDRPLSLDEGFQRVMVVVALLLPTFFFAAVRMNDLGFRVPMLAQFVLLLWAANLYDARRHDALTLRPRTVRLLALLTVLGLGSTLTQALVLRLVPPAADAGLIEMPGMYAPDRHLGERTADLRAAYTWLQDHTSANARIQHHPHPNVHRTEQGLAFPPALYSQRPFVAYDDDYSTLFAVPFETYTPIAEAIASAFEVPDADHALAIAQRFGLAAYVVTDLDPVWQDRTSWVWTRTANFERPRARVFLIPRALPSEDDTTTPTRPTPHAP